MKKKFWFFPLALLLAAALFQVSIGADVSESDRLQIITKLTGQLIGRQHYRQRPLDQRVSGQIFDEYIKLLDPNRMYFTEADLRGLEPQRQRLSAELNEGRADFAFEAYAIFKKRFDEFHHFAENELKQPFDFTVDESFTPDRRKLPRPKDDAELKALWRAKLKSDVLYFRLIKRSLETDQASRAGGDEQLQIRKLWERQSPEEKLLKRLRDLQNYYDQREKIDILSMYLGAVAAVYGPHSGYLQPKQDEDFEINMSLSLTGIGATLTSDDGYIRVVDVVPGGPAALDGRLHPEDRIIAVAQENGEPVDVIDMSVDNAVKLIRGAVGTKVTLTVLPGKKGRNAVPENITITRAKVLLKDSEAQGEIRDVKLADGQTVKVGIIELPSFYMDFAAAFRGDPDFKSCTRDVKKLLEDFKRAGVQSVVMDLRGNGGGSLPEAITLTGLFIKTGPVVQVRQANRSIQVEQDRDPEIAWNGPLVVLVNKFSASASEIFTGAIKDYRRGLIVGDSRTFGKGTVLSMIQLERMLNFINRRFPAGSVRLETAMFFRINGSSVQQLGVEPDLPLPSVSEVLEVGELFSDNHLPWDSIAPQSYRLTDNTLETMLPELRRHSAARIAASPDYQKLIRRVAQIKTQMDKKSISLNEEKRWQEYLAEKALNDQEEESLNAAIGRRPGAGRRTAEEDPVLQEAAAIAADFAEMKGVVPAAPAVKPAPAAAAPAPAGR